MALLHEKLIKHLRNRNHCKNCPYTEDCNSFEGCLMDLLAADAIEDLNFQIVELRKELNEEELAHYVLINLSRLGADLLDVQKFCLNFLLIIMRISNMISAEEARKNCEEYKKNLELRYARKRKEYIEELEQKIIDESKRGGYWITTANNFIDSEFLNEIKINFENKSFKVESQWGYADNEEKNTINNTYNNIFINFLRLYNQRK